MSVAPAGGDLEVSPNTSATYTLACEGAGGPVQEQAALTVTPRVWISSFEADPSFILDMAGNVWEWVNDRFSTGYYDMSPVNDPPGGEGPKGVVRGGSCADGDGRVADRFSHAPGDFYNVLGTRCAD